MKNGPLKRSFKVLYFFSTLAVVSYGMFLFFGALLFSADGQDKYLIIYLAGGEIFLGLLLIEIIRRTFLYIKEAKNFSDTKLNVYVKFFLNCSLMFLVIGVFVNVHEYNLNEKEYLNWKNEVTSLKQSLAKCEEENKNEEVGSLYVYKKDRPVACESIRSEIRTKERFIEVYDKKTPWEKIIY